MKRYFVLSLLLISLFAAARSFVPPIEQTAAQYVSGTNYGTFAGAFAAPAVSSVTATTATYTAGSLYLGGTNKAITGGTVTGIAISKNNCDWPAFSSCEILYFTSGSALTHTTSAATAFAQGNIPVAFVTTDSNGTSTAITPASLNLPLMTSPPGVEQVTTPGTNTAMVPVITAGTGILSSGTLTVATLPYTSASTYTCVASGKGVAQTGTAFTATNQFGTSTIFTSTSSAAPFSFMCAGH